MGKISITNNNEVIINDSGLEFITANSIHTNGVGEVLENIGTDDTFLTDILYNTPMEQEEAGNVIDLLTDLFESQTIYNINQDGEYFVRSEVANILKERLGISIFSGMTNDESIAMWEVV